MIHWIRTVYHSRKGRWNMHDSKTTFHNYEIVLLTDFIYSYIIYIYIQLKIGQNKQFYFIQKKERKEMYDA